MDDNDDIDGEEIDYTHYLALIFVLDNDLTYSEYDLCEEELRLVTCLFF